ncbi:MAG: glycosyltransferase [Prevotella sp.]|jgi:glycosyltransferase involved in cell wall biosynthesis|nr:glycosyltransferase [Prevotella sp.]
MGLPKVSIIVPVHNAGSYFKKCLTSLINQTLKDIEIILVLDCPTDGSDKIAEEFAAKDDRIFLLYNKENLHTGLSRNRGMEIARGEYIGFLDHDDYCDHSMYELLYNKAKEEDTEITRCNFLCIYKTDSGDKEEQYIYPETSKSISNKEWIYKDVCSNKISCVIWNHIYRRDFLQKNNISFMDSREICSEDSIFFMEAYLHAASLSLIPEYLYYHVFHTSNTGKAYGYRSIKNRISFFETLYSLLENNTVAEDTCRSYLSDNIARSFYSASRQALLLFPLKKALSEIKQIRRNNLTMDCINYLFRKENRKVLRNLKPTIIFFLFILKTK